MPLDLSKVKVVGSVEEARAAGLNVRHFYTCGPEVRPGILGCPMYERCDHPEKDEVGFVTWSKDGAPLPKYEPGAIRSGPGPLTCAVTKWRRTVGGQFSVVNH